MLRFMNPSARNTTRTALLNAAFREISHCGFQGASLDWLLRTTSLTTGAPDYHCASKQTPGLAVIEEVIAPCFGRLAVRPPREAAGPLASLPGVLQNEAARPFGHDAPLGCALKNPIRELSPIEPSFPNYLENVLRVRKHTRIDAPARSQHTRRIRGDIDRRKTGLLMLGARDGCFGIGRTRQSAASLRHCMTELHLYVSSLMARTIMAARALTPVHSP